MYKHIRSQIHVLIQICSYSCIKGRLHLVIIFCAHFNSWFFCITEEVYIHMAIKLASWM